MATKKNQYRAQPIDTIDFDAAMARADSMLASSQPAEQAKQGAGVLRTMGDMAIKGAQGVVDLGASAVGLGNMVTGGMVGDGMGAMGYDPKRTNLAMGQYLSQAQKDADAKVQNAEGFLDTVGQAATEPRFLAGAVVQSLPGLLAMGGAQGAVARSIAGKAALSTAEGAAAATGLQGAEALTAALSTQAGGTAAKAAIQAAEGKLIALGAASEGAQTAGGIAQEAQQAGRTWDQYTPAALGAGAMTAAIGFGAGKIMGDAGTKIFTGADTKLAGSLPMNMAKSGFSEGALEEMPQSASEQAFKNLAMGESDLMKGVPNAAGAGLVTGAAMGLGFGAMGGSNAKTPQQAEADVIRATELVPASGPMSIAANAGTQAKAAAVNAGSTEKAPTLQLGNTPDPLLGFPDGTVARRSEMDAYINGLPEDKQMAARTKMMGLEPQPMPPSFAGILDTDSVYAGWSNVQDGSDRAVMRDQMDYVAKTYGPNITLENKEAIKLDLKQQFKWFRAAPPAQQDAALSVMIGPVTPSQAAGINPAAGPMSAAGAVALDSGATQAIQLEEANAADQAAYEQATSQQEAQAAEQDTVDKPITTGKLAEAQLSEEDKRAILFSNQSVADGGIQFEGTQDGDVLNGMGAPFKTKMAALRRATMEGKDWSIAPVFDGFVARRKDAMPAETNTPTASVGGNITTLAETEKPSNQPLAVESPAPVATENVAPAQAPKAEAGIPVSENSAGSMVAWSTPKLEYVTATGESEAVHKSSVERAIKAGKTVPPAVLADYPELQATAPVTQPAQPVAGEGAGSSQPTQVAASYQGDEPLIGEYATKREAMDALEGYYVGTVQRSGDKFALYAKNKKPAATAPAKKEQAKADLEHLFGVPEKRTKALDRIAKGTAYFGTPAKASVFISSNGLSSTHKPVKTSATRWDIVAKDAQAPAVVPAEENTVESVARAVQIKVAQNRRKYRESDRAKRVAKGYAPNSTAESEQADYDEEISKEPGDVQKSSAANLIGTDPEALIGMFTKGRFEASEEVFKDLTGVKIKGLSVKDKKAALYKWAKWTPEQIAASEKKDADKEAVRAEGFKQDDKESALRSSWRSLERLKVKNKDGKVLTGQEFIQSMVADGYDKAHTQKKGAITVYGLANGGQFTSLKNKDANDFLKAAIAYGGLDKALAFVDASKAPEIEEYKAAAPVVPKQSVKARIEEARQARADYFTPGNIVSSYGGGTDEVISYTAPDSNGEGWKVKVHAVKKVDGEWVRIGKPQDARSHNTQPDAQTLKAGPMDKASGEVKYSEPRADGQPFPNADARGQAAAPISDQTKARNLLMELQAKQDANGMVGDDRLETQINQVKREIKAMDVADKPAKAPEAAKPAAKTPSTNTIFTEDAAAAARARLKAKLGRLNSGLDPETMMDGITLAGYHIEKGARSFAAFTSAMIGDLGDAVKPYLKSWYMGVKFDPRAAAFDGMDSAAAVESADLDAATTADKPSLDTTEGRHAVAKLVSEHLMGGNKFATIIEARKFIADQTGTKVEPGSDQAKRADEAIELGVVIAARDIVEASRKQGRSDEVIYTRLVSLYESQPSLNVRDSVSLRNQAYSTPIPLAFVASRLAQITPTKKVGEPTAGNGALMMEANPANATVNEIQDDRLEALRVQGFKPTQNDAAAMAFAPKSLDSMAMNPPFGALNGQKWTFGDFTTGEIDHAIVLNSLEALKDNGDAVLIIGGTLAQEDGARKDAYRGKAKREFFFKLYGQYNVVDHFTVSGDLYKKQGAAFPVDVLVIRGRGKSSRGLPAAQLPQLIDTWDQLKGKLNEASSVGTDRAGSAGSNPTADETITQPPVVPGVAASAPGVDGKRDGRDGSGASVGPVDGGRAAGDTAGAAGATGAPDAAGQRGNADAPAQPGNTRGATPARSDQQPGSTNSTRPDKPAGVDAGSRVGTDSSGVNEAAASGRLQVKYANFSGNRSVNTLVSTNHLSAIESAFNRLKAKVGDIDEFVRAELQYEPEQFKKSFSAEQVEALALAIDNIGQGKGFIIGDQTGIGKGRVVAAMIRYAKLNGKTPVFVTQMPDLYGDMMRDLNDIGMGSTKPLMTNNNASVPLDAEALSWFSEKQGIQTRITELLDAMEGVAIDDLGEKATTLAPDERAKSIALALKTSTNPEMISLRDEIKELKASLPERRGKFLDTPAIESHEKSLKQMVQSNSIGDHDVIFTTYNQMAALDSGKPKKNKETGVKKPASAPVFGYRSDFLDHFVNANSMLILDESHNAGEAGDGKFPKVGDVVRRMIAKSGGVFYSSATFAKNTAVMDVYSKTDLGSAFDTPDALVSAVNSVPMQQITSSMLVEAGQYLRRERSFDGIEYKTETVEVDQQAAEDMATAMRMVVEFDKAKKGAISELQNQLDQEGAVMAAVDGGGSMGSVDSMNFTSVMHNVVNTFLLALKADAAAKAAVDAIRAGEKPVITVANTMEMFITEFAKESGLGVGDKLNATFADVLKRYLDKTRKASIKHANGESEVVSLTDEQLGPDGVDAYNAAYEFIDEMNLDIPISPIDHIKQRIEEAGFSIGEITGRQTVVVNGVLRSRNKAELNTAGKKNTIAKYNGGTLDALIINRSGSTGLSMHASETFADQRRRVMIVAQAELDINNHMQMLGRINRTGQVTANGKSAYAGPAQYGLPRYAQMTANVPIELRPAAVLSNKMAGLNANTTAGRKSSVEDKSALDFMNKYGDRVAAEMVGGNSQLNGKLGYPIKLDENGSPIVAGAISKVTGRIGLLPLSEQTDLYSQLATEYGELIAQLDALGQNDLEAKTYPLDAETIENKVIQKADDKSTSPFTSAVSAEKVSMKKLGKPYPKAKVLEMVLAHLNGRKALDVRSKTLADVTGKIDEEVRVLMATRDAADAKDSASIQKQIDALALSATLIRGKMPTVGVSVMLRTDAGNMYGIVTRIERTGKAKSAGSLSAWKVQIAVVDGARSMTLPLSQIYNGAIDVPPNGVVISLADTMTIPNVARTGFDTVPVIEGFDRGQTDSRETRVIITGNILRGYGVLRGRLLNYTDNKGGIKQGILMPADFDMNAVQARFTASLKSSKEVIALLEKGGTVVDKSNGGETLRISMKNGSYFVEVSKTGLGKKLAKNAGDLNFVSSGNKMRVRVWDAEVLTDFLNNTVKPEGIALVPDSDSAKLVDGTAFSRSAKPTRGLPTAEVTSIVDAIRARWGNAPEIIIAADMSDPLIPQKVRDQDQMQKSQGATGEPEGFVYRGKVYILASEMATPSDVMRVLFHESLGHLGLRGVFGDKLKPILQQLAALRRGDVAAKAKQYGLDMNTEAGRLEAAEEVLAEMAQTKPELGYVQRAIGLIRGWLRANVTGFSGMKLTDADIVAQFILPARRFIEGKGGPTGGMKAPASGRTTTQPAFSRSLGATLTDAANNVRGVKLAAGYEVGDLINGVPGKLNWWHRTVGTQYNLAQRSKPFKRVFDSVQNFIGDVSYFASEAADLAPNILPKLENLKDIGKSPLSADDTKAISAPIFEGTLTWGRDESGKPVKMEVLEAAAAKLTTDQKSQRLLRGNHVTDKTLRMWRGLPIDQYTAIIEGKYESDMLKAGVVWTDAELKSLFKLTDKQIPLYREFRAATNKSLTNLAIADMLRFAGKDVEPIRESVLDAKTPKEAADTLAEYLRSLAAADGERSDVLMDTADKVIGKGDKAQDLMDRGYAPLSRFGKYTLDVVDENGDRVYFGMFENRFDAAKMNRQMQESFPGATINQGTVSEQAYALFAGVTPETLELFGDMLGLESTGDGAANEAFQTYLKLAKSSRSAMKRLIQRKGIAGFSEDAGRVLAGFIYSNARQTSSSLHMGEMTQAATDKDAFRNQGELQDAAAKLVDYIKNPQEEAQAFRGLLFAQYIGGSIASAMVNMTQPLTMTLPWLAQFGGITSAAKQMASAVKDANKPLTGNARLDAALKRAEEDGTVSPQEVHQLMQQAQGRGTLKSGDGTMAGNALATANNTLSRVMLAWGKPFSWAEQFNRRSTFIAAYRTAVAQGMTDPDAFARRAISETQGIYNKGNKPALARGAAGSILFTFKQYSISYVEMLSRMAKNGPEGKRAALLALGILFLLSGAGGMPGADDLDDLISGALQSMGYNFDSRSKRQAFFAEMFGQGGAQFMERGISGLPGAPIDVSGRMGLGNLIPGTGLFVKKVDHTRDVVELAGPGGDLVKRGFEAGSKLIKGEVLGANGAAATIAPKAAQNLAKAFDMANMGMYRDAKGAKVLDTDATDAVMKAIGFQPNDVKKVQDASFEVQRMIGLNKLTESELSARWALGLFEKDSDKVKAAREDLAEWNRANPESPIRIKFTQVLQRVKKMNETKAERMIKTAPQEIRKSVRAELEASR